jgi:hypothetical protein
MLHINKAAVSDDHFIVVYTKLIRLRPRYAQQALE